MTPLDLTGRKFERLTAIRVDTTRSKPKRRLWLCRCDCGNEVSVGTSKLTSGWTGSCGCKQRESRTVHGAHKTPEYTSWCKMLNRCRCKTNQYYYNYGGRGISVCREWQESFAVFLAHIGPRPTPLHTIDRIKVDGNYEPGNVRWATRKEQAHNKRSTKITEADVVQIRELKGRARVMDIAARYGVSPGYISNIQAGRTWIVS